MQKITPPKSEEDLLKRAQQLAGLSLATLAFEHQIPLPYNSTQGKGFVGQLLEQSLGATAGTKSAPDFESLHIELKTIPINKNNKVCESTYVCRVPLRPPYPLNWTDSCVYKKLNKVLWIPVQADADIPLAHRKIGMPILWKMPTTTEQILKQDWEEVMEFISLGQIESLTAHKGIYLQVRPKAAHSRILSLGIGPEGEKIKTQPKGFYLRSKFTQLILDESYIN